MDTIKLFGAEPANFLDVGGGATPEKVTGSLQDRAEEPKGRAILVNIFRRHHECDTIATGVITACKAVNLGSASGGAHEGHQQELGKEDAGRIRPAHHQCDTMAEAAQQVVAAVK